MRYFDSENYNLFEEDTKNPELEVLFDDTSDKIENTSEEVIYDEDGEKYINIDKAEDSRDDYLETAMSGLDQLIKMEMKDNEKDSDAWETAMSELRKDYKDSKIFPYVLYDDFMSYLDSEIGEMAVEQLNEDMDEPDYEED